MGWAAAAAASGYMKKVSLQNGCTVVLRLYRKSDFSGALPSIDTTVGLFSDLKHNVESVFNSSLEIRHTTRLPIADD